MAARPRVFVRRTRAGMELRVDGTLASFFRPGQPTVGPVWDALAAPLVSLPPGRLRRLLVLGFGGGSVARVARSLVPAVHIVGVEHDRQVLEAARQGLGLDELKAELVVDDAVAFLERERRTFDAVVDDVYEVTLGHVYKPRRLLERYDLVRHRVARGGVLIVDTIHETSAMARLLERGPGTLVRLGVKGYYNQVLAIGPAALEASTLRRTLSDNPILSASLAHFTLRTLRA